MISRSDLQAQFEEADRRFGWESLYYLAKFVLGYKDMRPSPHKDVCRFAERIVSGWKKGLDLEPRGVFKTTIFSQALPISLILHDPNIRILLDSSVLQNSIDNLGVIKRHFESPKLRYLYGDYTGQHWTAEEITVSKRTRIDLKEPTVRCASPERMQTGPHYDVIIADDLVSRENAKTPEQREMVKEHFRLLFSVLEPGGLMIVIGTRWHYDDLYGMILEEFKDFPTRIKDAEKDGPGGGLYFKERLTAEFLKDQRDVKLGRETYACQYKNDPAPEGKDSKFQKAWFKPFKDLPSTRYGFIAVDPGGEKKGSDEWAIITAYCDPVNDLYFHKLFKGNWRTDTAWSILFGLARQMGRDLMAVGLETTGGQKYLLEGLQDQMRKRDHFFNVVPLAHASDSKDYRILRLQPRYQCGSIWHSPDMGPLEDQLRRWPKGKDDLADVASMILEISMAPRERSKKKAEFKSFDEMVWHNVLHRKTQRVVHPTLGSEW